MFLTYVAPLAWTLGPVVVMVTGGWFATRSARPENTPVSAPAPVSAPEPVSTHATAPKAWEYYGPLIGWYYR